MTNKQRLPILLKQDYEDSEFEESSKSNYEGEILDIEEEEEEEATLAEKSPI